MGHYFCMFCTHTQTKQTCTCVRYTNGCLSLPVTPAYLTADGLTPTTHSRMHTPLLIIPAALHSLFLNEYVPVQTFAHFGTTTIFLTFPPPPCFIKNTPNCYWVLICNNEVPLLSGVPLQHTNTQLTPLCLQPFVRLKLAL